jgi:hypothetical protein
MIYCNAFLKQILHHWKTRFAGVEGKELRSQPKVVCANENLSSVAAGANIFHD